MNVDDVVIDVEIGIDGAGANAPATFDGSPSRIKADTDAWRRLIRIGILGCFSY